MTVLRFFLYLFVLICVLAGSCLVVAAICLLVGFPPLFIAVGLGCGLFAVVLAKTSRT